MLRLSVLLLLPVLASGYPRPQDERTVLHQRPIHGPVDYSISRRDNAHEGPRDHGDVTVAIIRRQIPAPGLSSQEELADDSVLQGEDPDRRLDEEDVRGDSQRFFPSFSPLFTTPPLGHSRPQQYHLRSQAANFRPDYSLQGLRDLSYAHSANEGEVSANVLGSGNFGVIRGGTYYTGDGDEIDEDVYTPYYHGNNGHQGRPSFYQGNPRPSYRQGNDFFANFRDFADISTPTKPSYSQYYVVYVNQNATGSEVRVLPAGQAPNNIIEQLSMLDTTTHSPSSKLSKGKRKLAQYKNKLLQKENSKHVKPPMSPKEMYEPLLALS